MSNERENPIDWTEKNINIIFYLTLQINPYFGRDFF